MTIHDHTNSKTISRHLTATNYVNAHDTGREVQPAFYDGNAQYDACVGCTGVFGWNPVLAGDKYDQGTPTPPSVADIAWSGVIASVILIPWAWWFDRHRSLASGF